MIYEPNGSKTLIINGDKIKILRVAPLIDQGANTTLLVYTYRCQEHIEVPIFI